MTNHRAAIAWLPILSAAALTLLLLLITAEQYGYHRDELYFLVAAEHLDWGYVDQPPLTPAVAAAATALFGDSLTGLRLVPALAAVAIVLLTGLIAREMGGGRFAQGFAALCAAISTLVLAIGHLLATSTFDLLAWVVIAWLVARILRGGDERQWLIVGAVVGIGLPAQQAPRRLPGGRHAGCAGHRRTAPPSAKPLAVGGRRHRPGGLHAEPGLAGGERLAAARRGRRDRRAQRRHRRADRVLRNATDRR